MHIVESHKCQSVSDNITRKSVLYIYDAFDQDALSNLLQSQVPAYIISDGFLSVECLTYKIYCAPLFLAESINKVVENLPTEQQYQTRHIFNFMINKKQINRFLCMKLVELFKLDSYDYTWSGVDANFDMSMILDELNQLGSNSIFTVEQKSLILSSIKISPKFFGRNEIKNNSHIDFISTSWTWNHGLNEIFCGSVVSLITESLSFEKSTIFTEKTLYAVLGKTFPLWVGGGINQAQEFKKMGFDTFDDVIDHSYQHCATLIERCYYAFKRNLHILTDYEYASKIRESMMPRLEHNQQLIKNKQVDIFCRQQISQWPEDLQQAISYKLKHR